MIERDKAFELAAALNEKSWGFVTMRIIKDQVGSVSWHIREGLGLYERHLEDAMALAHIHGMSIHIDVNGRCPEVRFSMRDPGEA